MGQGVFGEVTRFSGKNTAQAVFQFGWRRRYYRDSVLQHSLIRVWMNEPRTASTPYFFFCAVWYASKAI
jgi:hypothetical protein